MDHVPTSDLRTLLSTSVDSFYLIKSVAVRKSKNDKEYLDLVLTDAEGEVPAKCWEVDDFRRSLTAGSVVKVRALVEDYMGSLQLNLKIIRAPAPDEVDMAVLVPSAPESAEDMYALAMSYAGRIGNVAVRELVCALWEDRRERLLVAPAAVQMHHSIRAGLLMHVTTMLRAAEGLLPVYTKLDPDLLYAGILLHDLAKLDEMQINELGLSGEYTPNGQLLGHITLGVMLLEQTGEALGIDERTLRVLQHMVLSHHEVPEYGSPRPPMFPEAEVLQTLDRLDARLYDHFMALKHVEPGQFSPRVRSMEGRRLFKVALVDEEDEAAAADEA